MSTSDAGNSGETCNSGKSVGPLRVIYVARNMQQAHLLKNALRDLGIQAIVSNETLEGGAGVDVLGWATASRVLVEEKDAQIARRVALDFEQKTLTAAFDNSNPAEASIVGGTWPRCPNCGEPRLTRCPICNTAGTAFPEADKNFYAAPGPLEEATPQTCACGASGCSAHPHEAVQSSDDLGESTAEIPPQDVPSSFLRCPTCDEPFVPEYCRQCVRCGHVFDDGYEVEPGEKPSVRVNSRVVATVLGAVIVVVLVLGYFVILVAR